MIPVVDLSNWNSPYDLYAFDWDKISGGWEKMQREGLAGGSLKGNALGLGDDDEVPIPEVEVIGQCDFTEGEAVEQIQEQLGVPVTGFFDEATCEAWHEEFGEPPTARALEAATEAACASIVVPRCASVDALGTGKTAGYVLVGAGAALVGALLLWRKR